MTLKETRMVASKQGAYTLSDGTVLEAVIIQKQERKNVKNPTTYL